MSIGNEEAWSSIAKYFPPGDSEENQYYALRATQRLAELIPGDGQPGPGAAVLCRTGVAPNRRSVLPGHRTGRTGQRLPVAWRAAESESATAGAGPVVSRTAARRPADADRRGECPAADRTAATDPGVRIGRQTTPGRAMIPSNLLTHLPERLADERFETLVQAAGCLSRTDHLDRAQHTAGPVVRPGRRRMGSVARRLGRPAVRATRRADRSAARRFTPHPRASPPPRRVHRPPTTHGLARPPLP
jgi:hypothetical protein